MSKDYWKIEGDNLYVWDKNMGDWSWAGKINKIEDVPEDKP